MKSVPPRGSGWVEDKEPDFESHSSDRRIINRGAFPVLSFSEFCPRTRRTPAHAYARAFRKARARQLQRLL